MRKFLALITFFCLAVVAQGQSQSMIQYYAADAVTLPLWSQAESPLRTNIPAGATDYLPQLYVFPLKSSTEKPARAILLCPGGAYGAVSLFREGLMWKHFFRSENIVLAVVNYRLPYGNHEVPMGDVLQAIRLLKLHAAEWGINPTDIGIMGFSAGGHLASTVALQAPVDLRPAFQILFYPVITMNASFTHPDTRRNLLGDSPSRELVCAYSGELNVTPDAPRAFIATGSADNVVPALNSATYYSALLSAGVKADIHTWPTNVHGFAIEFCTPWQANVMLELRDWLHSF